MTRTRRKDTRLSAAPSKLKRLESEIQRLEAAYRQNLIERVLDMEIAIGISQEKERESALSRMSDASKYPAAALEHMRKSILVILSQRNHPAEASTDQKEPQRDYIK